MQFNGVQMKAVIILISGITLSLVVLFFLIAYQIIYPFNFIAWLGCFSNNQLSRFSCDCVSANIGQPVSKVQNKMTPYIATNFTGSSEGIFENEYEEKHRFVYQASEQDSGYLCFFYYNDAGIVTRNEYSPD